MPADHRALKLALRARLLTVPSLPAARVWENARYLPIAGTPFVAEKYIAANGYVRTYPATRGDVTLTGLYLVEWYGIAGYAEKAIRAGVSEVISAFAPGWCAVLENGDELRARVDVAPWPGDITPLDADFTVCVVTIPWRCNSKNQLVAA